MTVWKNEIPILEYDDNQESVIMPDHEKLGYQLPSKAVFAFLGECIEDYAVKNNYETVGEFISITKKYPIFIGRHCGERICICQAPAGAAAAAQILDWLIHYGVKKIISAGSCGTLEAFPENVFLVPVKALRDEGVSYHYLPPSRFVELDKAFLRTIEEVFKSKGLPYAECVTWTTDGFFRETKDKIQYRKSEGCSVVEMECAALAACARFRHADFGQILFTADSLANIHEYDERGWGEASLQKALLLCLDILAKCREKSPEEADGPI